MQTIDEITLPLIDPTIKGQLLDTGVIGFSFAPQIVFGYGCLNRVGFLSLFSKAKNVFIVTDPEIEKLNKEIGIPEKLSECGVKESDIEIMITNAINDISAITNPLQPVTKELVETVYRAAF